MFWGFVLPVWEYCSAVWCLIAEKHIKIVDGGVSGKFFSTGGVFECDIVHRRSVLNILYALLVQVLCYAPSLWCSTCMVYASAGYTRCLAAHLYTYAPPRCRTSQYRRIFIPVSVSLWNDLVHHVGDSVESAG